VDFNSLMNSAESLGLLYAWTFFAAAVIAGIEQVAIKIFWPDNRSESGAQRS
jgi:hypothetical protein